MSKLTDAVFRFIDWCTESVFLMIVLLVALIALATWMGGGQSGMDIGVTSRGDIVFVPRQGAQP